MKNRMMPVDRLRILATVLVVLHHTAITYGGGGDWIYKEGGSEISSIVLTLFTALNQSFFMGMFFLFSGYFSLKSLDAKGPGKFIISRLLRLGIPLTVYYFLLAPVFIYIYTLQISPANSLPGLGAYLLQAWTTGRGLGVGPLWFVQAILVFSAILLILYKLAPGLFPKEAKPLPGNGPMLLVLIGAGILTFTARLLFPIGIWIANMQLAHFVQYILLFSVGVMAARRNWLEVIPKKQGKFFTVIAATAVLFLPVFFFLSIVMTGNDDLSPFMGGFTWQSALNSLWEQIAGGCIILALLYQFGKWKKETGKLHAFFSKGAYTVYIIHTGVLVEISLLMANAALPPLLKFAITGTLSVLACFLLAWPIRQIPGVKKIL